MTGDTETLKKAPFVDTVGISVKIDSLVNAVDKLPLVVEKPQAPAPAAVSDKSQQSWLISG